MNSKGFLTSLENGLLRVAEKGVNGWVVHPEVKARILDLFRNSEIVEMPGGFLDKAPFIPRIFSKDDKIRMVPGGTTVRAGAFIGQNVVIMPPSYINVGAYVDEGTMIDSHVLVGSCAQVGKYVHLSTAVQLGGVLEPVGQLPVIIEDYCFIGAGTIIVEGILIRERAVIASGVVLSASIPIYDLVNQKILKGEVPKNAVVVPGTRSINNSLWAREQGINLGCAVIIKYRDEKTNASLELESALRF